MTTADAATGASTALRERTAAHHDAIDAAYARFDLHDRDGYAAFLTAHARIVPPVETILADHAALPRFDLRTAALAADLADMGLDIPPALKVGEAPDDAAAWGMFYVVEGSRLGGVMLARRVGAAFPARYLSAAHGKGGWRTVRAEIDAAATTGDAGWLDRAVQAAKQCFTLYGDAAK